MGVVFVSVILALAIIGPALAIWLWVKLARAQRVSLKYMPLVDVQAEFLRLARERDDARSAIGNLKLEADAIRAEIVQVRDVAEMQSVGLYRRQFDFKDAAEYKRKLEMLRDRQESMVKAGIAAVCSSSWTINNSVAEGRKTTSKILKLMLRAFNGECDSLVANVRYDNLASYTLRIRKAFDAINKLGAGFSCCLTEEYARAKLDELAMVNEYQEQVQAEKEEQRRIKEEMREEARRAEELERLRREADDDEKKYARLLKRAQDEASDAEGDRRQKLLDHVADLEARLREAQAKSERSKSLAQMTRAGHVYVLSNIGSFGERVFKIGMTRRLDPLERVGELSDASVPFAFDVHAMIYTEDAPRLERALHEIFDRHRVNRVNQRKEFFRVDLEAIAAKVREHHGEFRLTMLAEAIEYRKTLGLLEAGSSPVGLLADAGRQASA